MAEVTMSRDIEQTTLFSKLGLKLRQKIYALVIPRGAVVTVSIPKSCNAPRATKFPAILRVCKWLRQDTMAVYFQWNDVEIHTILSDLRLVAKWITKRAASLDDVRFNSLTIHVLSPLCGPSSRPKYEDYEKAWSQVANVVPLCKLVWQGKLVIGPEGSGLQNLRFRFSDVRLHNEKLPDTLKHAISQARQINENSSHDAFTALSGQDLELKWVNALKVIGRKVYLHFTEFTSYTGRLNVERVFGQEIATAERVQQQMFVAQDDGHQAGIMPSKQQAGSKRSVAQDDGNQADIKTSRQQAGSKQAASALLHRMMRIKRIASPSRPKEATNASSTKIKTLRLRKVDRFAPRLSITNPV